MRSILSHSIIQFLFNLALLDTCSTLLETRKHNLLSLVMERMSPILLQNRGDLNAHVGQEAKPY